jgi:hypothetical protein
VSQNLWKDCILRKMFYRCTRRNNIYVNSLFLINLRHFKCNMNYMLHNNWWILWCSAFACSFCISSNSIWREMHYFSCTISLIYCIRCLSCLMAPLASPDWSICTCIYNCSCLFTTMKFSISFCLSYNSFNSRFLK